MNNDLKKKGQELIENKLREIYRGDISEIRWGIDHESEYNRFENENKIAITITNKEIIINDAFNIDDLEDITNPNHSVSEREQFLNEVIQKIKKEIDQKL